VLLRGPKNNREAVKHFGPAPGEIYELYCKGLGDGAAS
jgi:hypothetical protein